jgi:hypothetical protein
VTRDVRVPPGFFISFGWKFHLPAIQSLDDNDDSNSITVKGQGRMDEYKLHFKFQLDWCETQQQIYNTKEES